MNLISYKLTEKDNEHGFKNLLVGSRSPNLSHMTQDKLLQMQAVTFHFYQKLLL